MRLVENGSEVEGAVNMPRNADSERLGTNEELFLYIYHIQQMNTCHTDMKNHSHHNF